MRNLLIFILILIAIWWVRRALQRMSAGRPQAGESQRATSSGRADPEQMLACAHCGVHVPESEGAYDGNTFYCCDAHRRLGPGR